MVGKMFVVLVILSMISPVFADRRETYFDQQQFHIEEIEREDGEISIEFSVPVNPDSVAGENILVDGKPLPPETAFFFNRRGDKLLIREPSQWRGKRLCIQFKEVAAASGKILEELPAFHLYPDDGFERDELDEVDWCHHYEE